MPIEATKSLEFGLLHVTSLILLCLGTFSEYILEVKIDPNFSKSKARFLPKDFVLFESADLENSHIIVMQMF